MSPHRRPWARELQRLEVLLLKAVVADPSWLAPHDESALRWALSLSRISAVQVRPDEGTADVVDIGHATDRVSSASNCCDCSATGCPLRLSIAPRADGPSPS